MYKIKTFIFVFTISITKNYTFHFFVLQKNNITLVYKAGLKQTFPLSYTNTSTASIELI